MAEGGGFDRPEDGEGNDLIDFGGDDDDTTQPFQPTAASTPYGEQYEMQTFRQERHTAPSYEETPLLGDDEIESRLSNLRFNKLTGLLNTQGLRENPLSQEDRDKQIGIVKRLIKARYPHANVEALVLGYSSKNPLDIVYKGPKGGEYKVVLADGSDLQKSFLNLAAVKKELGPPASDIIQKASADITKRQKELQALRNSERLLRSKNEQIKSMEERIKEEQSRLDQIKEDQDADNKEEIKRKEQLLKNLKKDLKDRQKETKEFQKKIEAQEITKDKIAKLQSSILEEESKRNAMEERLNSTKTFDDLKEQESNLLRQNEEDQEIIKDDMATSFDKEAAEERVAARNEELARLQGQIAEREGAMPLRERVREIFKKYGVTVASVFLAAGVTIGAVVGAITSALKAMGKQIAGGLKNLGAKAASALPGLIGSIVGFLFKTAGQAIGFLAEHTWLLILAVVAFLFQKLTGRYKK